MAVTIQRTAWIDDDGTGTTGTVINNAIKTELYNQIDAALAALVPAGGGTVSGPFTIGGVLTVSGLGTHTFSASGAEGNIIKLENPHASFYTQLQMVAGASQVNLYDFSQGYTTSAYIKPSSGALVSAGAGGLGLVAADPAGTIRLYAGGTALQAEMTLGAFLPGGDLGANLGSATKRWSAIFMTTTTGTGTAVIQNSGGYLQLQSSAARFKEHIASWDLPSAALDRFLAVSPKLWDYTGQESGAAGFLADDLDALGIENAYGRSVLVNYDADGRPESNRDYAILGLQHLVLQDLAARVAALEGAR